MIRPVAAKVVAVTAAAAPKPPTRPPRPPAPRAAVAAATGSRRRPRRPGPKAPSSRCRRPRAAAERSAARAPAEESRRRRRRGPERHRWRRSASTPPAGRRPEGSAWRGAVSRQSSHVRRRHRRSDGHGTTPIAGTVHYAPSLISRDASTRRRSQSTTTTGHRNAAAALPPRDSATRSSFFVTAGRRGRTTPSLTVRRHAPLLQRQRQPTYVRASSIPRCGVPSKVNPTRASFICKFPGLRRSKCTMRCRPNIDPDAPASRRSVSSSSDIPRQEMPQVALAVRS